MLYLLFNPLNHEVSMTISEKYFFRILFFLAAIVILMLIVTTATDYQPDERESLPVAGEAPADMPEQGH